MDLQYRGQPGSHRRDRACHHLHGGALYGTGLLDPGLLGAGAVGDALHYLHHPATPLATMTKRLIEVRSYKLKPGTAAAFHAVVVSSGMPLLREWGTDVVA